jgi:uncharacterized protein DUF4350
VRKHSFVMLAVLAGAFLAGLWRLMDLRFAAGDVYPPYSSLRSDPLGTKAFHDSLAALPELTVERHHKALANIAKERATIFYPGVTPHWLEWESEDQLKQIETLATGGARVVIGVTPVRRTPRFPRKPAQPSEADEKKAPPLERLWHVGIGFASDAPPTRTVLYFRDFDSAWKPYGDAAEARIIERRFGQGSVVLLANSYSLSNQALEQDRDSALLAWSLGGNSKIIFDESHLGVEDTGSVGTLIRRLHFEGVVAALLLLAGLFIWMSAVPFLPPRRENTGAEQLSEQDAASGLVNLLRRNIPRPTLLRVAVAEWEKSRYGGHAVASDKIARVRRLAESSGDPVQVYNQAARILAERR